MKRKRKIIFVQPTGYNWTGEQGDITRDVNIMVPNGICSMCAYLEQRGIETAILDGYAIPRSIGEWTKIILNEKPSFVGVSTTTSSFLEGIKLARAIKEADRSIRIVFGGVHTSSLREKCMELFPVIDYGVVGEGEEAIYQLIIRDGENLEEVPGLLWRESDGLRGSSIKFSGLQRKMVELDSLPFPAFERLEGFPSGYKLPIFSYPKTPAVNIVTSRGCPYSCSYCDRSVFRKGFRYNSPHYMYELIAYLKKRWGIKHVTFYDDIFTANRNRVETFCRLMIEKPLGITFYCAGRANEIDRALLELLKNAGCWQISFGVESGDPEIVKAHRSQTDLENIKEKVNLIKKMGMRVKGLFIIGLPGETEETIKRTIEYATKCGFDEINLSKFTPFPGAPIYKNIEEFGTFEENWSKMNLLNFVFVPKSLTKERLEQLYRKGLESFYQRPEVISSYIKLMITSPHNLTAVIKHLPQFTKYLLWIKGG